MFFFKKKNSKLNLVFVGRPRSQIQRSLITLPEAPDAQVTLIDSK